MKVNELEQEVGEWIKNNDAATSCNAYCCDLEGSKIIDVHHHNNNTERYNSRDRYLP